MEQVILVDTDDRVLGTMEKLEAHEKGLLHRAFSILLFNKHGELLIQKRAASKYHSAGLWTNTCCSHPLPEESMEDATQRKLFQELGISGVYLEFAYKFIYKASLDKNLMEHECDYVYIGQFDGVPVANPSEVQDWKFQDLQSLRKELQDQPENFTEWFKLILNHPEIHTLAI